MGERGQRGDSEEGPRVYRGSSWSPRGEALCRMSGSALSAKPRGGGGSAHQPPPNQLSRLLLWIPTLAWPLLRCERSLNVSSETLSTQTRHEIAPRAIASGARPVASLAVKRRPTDDRRVAGQCPSHRDPPCPRPCAPSPMQGRLPPMHRRVTAGRLGASNTSPDVKRSFAEPYPRMIPDPKLSRALYLGAPTRSPSSTHDELAVPRPDAYGLPPRDGTPPVSEDILSSSRS